MLYTYISKFTVLHCDLLWELSIPAKIYVSKAKEVDNLKLISCFNFFINIKLKRNVNSSVAPEIFNETI